MTIRNHPNIHSQSIIPHSYHDFRAPSIPLTPHKMKCIPFIPDFPNTHDDHNSVLTFPPTLLDTLPPPFYSYSYSYLNHSLACHYIRAVRGSSTSTSTSFLVISELYATCSVTWGQPVSGTSQTTRCCSMNTSMASTLRLFTWDRDPLLWNSAVLGILGISIFFHWPLLIRSAPFFRLVNVAHKSCQLILLLCLDILTPIQLLQSVVTMRQANSQMRRGRLLHPRQLTAIWSKKSMQRMQRMTNSCPLRPIRDNVP